MRTTVDVDDDLFERAARKLPRGTSKKVVFNEALRAFVGEPSAAVPVFGALAHIPVRIHADFDDPVPGFDL
ncbi:hypothetical protein LBMAG42_01520 [Deltaproteobacteria bacterium]|nr:hypothetical protein LBMAG42_01520 [Deltaproteobacteria bacterium]